MDVLWTFQYCSVNNTYCSFNNAFTAVRGFPIRNINFIVQIFVKEVREGVLDLVLIHNKSEEMILITKVLFGMCLSKKC